MPLYYFNLYNRIGFVPDEEGRELPDTGAARTVALNGIRSVLAEDVLAGRLDLAGRLEIVDFGRRAGCSQSPSPKPSEPLASVRAMPRRPDPDQEMLNI